MLGRHPSLPADLVLNLSEYAYKLSQTIEWIDIFARVKIELASEKMWREYNSKKIFNGYTEGDAVWCYAHIVRKLGSSKLHCVYVGPYTVFKRINDVRYK